MGRQPVGVGGVSTATVKLVKLQTTSYSWKHYVFSF